MIARRSLLEPAYSRSGACVSTSWSVMSLADLPGAGARLLYACFYHGSFSEPVTCSSVLPSIGKERAMAGLERSDPG